MTPPARKKPKEQAGSPIVHRRHIDLDSRKLPKTHTSWAREDCLVATEVVDAGQTAIRLHEQHLR